MRKLNLGCGLCPKKGFINLDQRKLSGVDVIHDLNKFPYPFQESSVDVTELHHVLEHLNDPVSVLKELHRITKNSGKIVISVPHWSHFTDYGDLTHKHYFSSEVFGYFEREDPEYYGRDMKFKVILKKFSATRINARWANKILNPLLNLSHNLTELILCKFIPVSQIIFVLEVVK